MNDIAKPRKSSSYLVQLEKIKLEGTFLKDKPEETPESTLDALWLFVQGRPVPAIRAPMEPLSPLSPSQERQLQEITARRLSGEPLAHITGRQSFMGLTLLAGAEALIPRSETAILGQLAKTRLSDCAKRCDAPRILDVCTGCGNIALALASAEETSLVFGGDLSEAAVGLARKNARLLGLEKTGHVCCRRPLSTV